MEPARPLIGLTARTLLLRSSGRDRPAETVGRSYVAAVEAAGGRALLLPNADDAAAAEDYLDLVDGLVLTGGDDPHPRWFGEPPHAAIETVDERRDAFEIALVRGAYGRDLPVLGICRGVQMLNVALGGDIYQDLSSQTDSGLQHAQRTLEDGPWHEVAIRPGSVLERHAGPGPLRVNSFHHQACRALGAGLAASATAVGDDLIEAVEDPARAFFLGVQWHPEIGLAGGDEASKRLFAAFIETARKRALGASKGRRTVLEGR